LPRKQFSSEQIITILRETEVLLSQGMFVIEAARQLEISEQTYSRWGKENGGLVIGGNAKVPGKLPPDCSVIGLE